MLRFIRIFAIPLTFLTSCLAAAIILSIHTDTPTTITRTIQWATLYYIVHRTTQQFGRTNAAEKGIALITAILMLTATAIATLVNPTSHLQEIWNLNRDQFKQVEHYIHQNHFGTAPSRDWWLVRMNAPMTKDEQFTSFYFQNFIDTPKGEAPPSMMTPFDPNRQFMEHYSSEHERLWASSVSTFYIYSQPGSHFAILLHNRRSLGW